MLYSGFAHPSRFEGDEALVHGEFFKIDRMNFAVGYGFADGFHDGIRVDSPTDCNCLLVS